MIEFDIHVVDLSRLRPNRWEIARWAAGVVAAGLWSTAALAPPVLPAERRALYMLALFAVEAFGALSATLMLISEDAPLVARITDWVAFVASIMVWVIGVAADLWVGMTAGEGLLLALSVAAATSWLALVAFSARH
jgi:hypothetical protein